MLFLLVLFNVLEFTLPLLRKSMFLFLKIKCPVIETLELIIHCQVHMLNEVLLPVNVTVLARIRVFRDVINIKKGISILD